MRRGLVVGKFMPLHRGHQLLIETGLATVDELTVVVYDTFVDDESAKLMPASKRAGWVSKLYPQVHNVVVLPDPVEGDHTSHDDPSLAKVYADQVAFLGQFTHVFSSENYGAPYAKALGAEHVSVDAARDLMPISGTKFRSDMYRYRAFVDPLVYRSLIQKVVFVGTESTGKSTLARMLAQKYGTLHTSEYGRTLWEQHTANGTKPSFHDFLTIGLTQYEQEQAAVLHSNKFLFCDTNAWTTMLWSEMYYGTADSRLYDLVYSTADEYEWFLCENDFAWVDDGSRELKGKKAQVFQYKNYASLGELLEGCVNLLEGTIPERIRYVERELGL